MPTISRAEAACQEGQQLFTDLAKQAPFLDDLAGWIVQKILAGSKLFVCGNGGSAAEAQHFATELVGRFKANRRPFPALALSADGSLLTCICNDYPPETMFARQVEAWGQPGDLLVGLTTSGQSRNVLLALQAARAKGMHSLALLGKDGGVCKGVAAREWLVPAHATARIQEAHLWFIHLVCEMLDAACLEG